MTEMIATTMRSQGQGEQTESGGADESATAKERRPEEGFSWIKSRKFRDNLT